METNEILFMLGFVACMTGLIFCRSSLAYVRNERLSAFSWSFFVLSIASIFGLFEQKPLYWAISLGLALLILGAFTIVKSRSKTRRKGDRKKHQKFFLYAVGMLGVLALQWGLMYATIKYPIAFYTLIVINVFLILTALQESLENKVKKKEEHYVFMGIAIILFVVLMVINDYLKYLYGGELYTVIPAGVAIIISVVSLVYQKKELKKLNEQLVESDCYNDRERLFKEITHGKRWIVKVIICFLLITGTAYYFL